VRVLFDQGTPVPLRGVLTEHEVSTAYERGWSQLKNGELLDAAERAGFDVLAAELSGVPYSKASHRRRLVNLLNNRSAVVQ